MTNKLILRLTCSGMFAFLCLLLIKGEICHALDPQIYPSGLTPTEAQTKCGASGLVHDPLVWIKKSELCGREVWTCQGIFTQLSPWIEIVGCFFLRKQPTRVFKRSSPGYCEQACSTEYFGLSGKDSCICFDIKYIQFNSTLNISSCKTSNDEAVLLYKVYNGTIKRYKTEHGLCSTLTCTKPDVLDEVPCTADPGIQSLCENGMRSSLVQYWSFSQNQSFTNCSNQNRLLLNSSACQYFAHNLTVPAWTNVFREEIEVEKTIELFTDHETKSHLICLSTSSVVGGILGACFLVSVLAVLIVCKVRSKGMFRESNTRDYEDTHRENIQQTTYEGLDNTNETSLTATPNQTSVIDEFSAPVYEEMNQS